ncbi:hypothetical protein U9M48_004886 [Paspalum notatum var. saurae]|uniref:Uncharacterized protein n=1 Tax=Paspalum notatum var. saurae TaxID=547442 RepID=A0AAQ3SI05_PASNO
MPASSSSSSAAVFLVVVAFIIVSTLSSYGAAEYVCMGPCDNFLPNCMTWCRYTGLFGKGGDCDGFPGRCCCRR